MRRRRIKKLLIANRGEIAVRIIRTCHEMGIETVSVYSDADRNALHIVLSRYAERLPGETPQETYLNIPLLVELAKKQQVQAVHPGYGFLAENAEFAQALADENIQFVGPPAATITALGDKLVAKRIAESAGVPVIPGTPSPLSDVKEARAFMDEAGLPVIIKAAAGGGGRGMRIVRRKADFERAFHTAQSESKTAFGSDKVFLEKYIEEPRHIEFQILADARGEVIHLGERECSIQRRYQKLVEEAPSCVLTPELRREMGEVACRVAAAANYENAGTAEFLFDKQRNFYFMEMNTRLQVEHPVTEMVSNTDLVREQILIAEGKPLSYRQEEVSLRGASIECRINAEDPLHDFMPSLGRINRYLAPMGNGVRLDSAAYEGYTIPMQYDSLVGKLISFGEDRPTAIRKMLRALDEFIVTGIKTTIPFHQYVMNHPAFVSGKFSTSYVDEYYDGEAIGRFLASREEKRNLSRVAIAAALAYQLARGELLTDGSFSPDSSSSSGASARRPGPWQRGDPNPWGG